VKYRTIVADPPWPYEARTAGGWGPGRNGLYRSAPMPYPTMTVSAIAQLPVKGLAEQDAHLYLWTTQRFLRDGYDVLAAWGFKPSAVLVWSKQPKGMAGTFVASAEFVLFGRRGTLPALKRQIGTVFTWPRLAHSVKPEAFIDMVEQVSPGPYVELFSRRHRLGWDVQAPIQRSGQRSPMASRKDTYTPEAWERHKQRERERYAANKADPEWRKQHIDRGYLFVQINRALLNLIRQERGCIDCGTREGRLDFDHRPGEIKLFNLGRPRCSRERMIAEVAKCDVRCVRCHARRHGLERGGLNGSVWGNESANTAQLGDLA
jgi:N6-adenosine-specific RNA methylase IME4